jgi:hypothetical protein
MDFAPCHAHREVQTFRGLATPVVFHLFIGFRYGHAVAVASDGDVLVLGGTSTNSISSVERFRIPSVPAAPTTPSPSNQGVNRCGKDYSDAGATHVGLRLVEVKFI